MNLLRLFGFFLAVLAGAAHAVTEADLLETEKACRLDTTANDGRTVVIKVATTDRY